MRNNIFLKLILFFALLSAAFSAAAWNRGISLGYGGGSDINHHTDTNSGAFLSAEMMSLKQRHWLNFTLNGSLGQWYSTAPSNKDLFTAALSLAFRFYPWDCLNTHPYFLASVGPAYMSDRKFGRNEQGGNMSFQSILGLGAEFGQAKRIDLNMRMVHFSNATLMTPNEGFNIFYVFSLGYLF